MSNIANNVKNTIGSDVLDNASGDLKDLKKEISQIKSDKANDELVDDCNMALPSVDRVKSEVDGNIQDKKRFEDGEGTKLITVLAKGIEDLNESIKGKESIEEVGANEQGRQVVDVKLEQDDYMDLTDAKGEIEPSVSHVDGQGDDNVQLRELEEENEDVIFLSQSDGPKQQSVKEEEDCLEQTTISDAVDIIFNNE